MTAVMDEEKRFRYCVARSRHRDWNAAYLSGVVEPGAMRVYRS
jgi:hypothetical protein